MRSSIELFPLVAATVAVGFLLTAKRNPTAVSPVRQSEIADLTIYDERIGDRSDLTHDNQRVANEVCDALMKAKLGGAEIDIFVTAREIMLRGVVDSQEQWSTAASAAASVSKSRPVMMALKIDRDRIGARSGLSQDNQQVANGVRKALLQAKLGRIEIEIRVQNGAIELTGIVARPEQRIAAEQAAASVAHSMRVINRITIGTQAQVGPAESQRRSDTSGGAHGPQGATSDAADLLHEGITMDDALAAIDATKRIRRMWGGSNWTEICCTSPRFPEKSVFLTFQSDASNTPRLKRWISTDDH
ncbi:MAG: BON domain-containing protein [Planctomycetales bacterium]